MVFLFREDVLQEKGSVLFSLTSQKLSFNTWHMNFKSLWPVTSKL